VYKRQVQKQQELQEHEAHSQDTSYIG